MLLTLFVLQLFTAAIRHVNKVGRVFINYLTLKLVNNILCVDYVDKVLEFFLDLQLLIDKR